LRRRRRRKDGRTCGGGGRRRPQRGGAFASPCPPPAPRLPSPNRSALGGAAAVLFLPFRCSLYSLLLFICFWIICDLVQTGRTVSGSISTKSLYFILHLLTNLQRFAPSLPGPPGAGAALGRSLAPITPRAITAAAAPDRSITECRSGNSNHRAITATLPLLPVRS